MLPRHLPVIGLSAAVFMTACSKKEIISAESSRGDYEVADSKAASHGQIDYNRDVQPILSYYCYHCHGPDTATREPKGAPLRLDLRDMALSYKNEQGVKTIVPGKPDESELIRRIESHDPDLLMPQDPEKKLSGEQIALLREWIKQGAEFRDHWAFEKPQKKTLPEVENKGWAKNAIDHYILAKLEEKSLTPNGPAGRSELIRRVTLDLIGLLPTPKEVDDFLNDPADDDAAYAKVVDRLLASDAYGEHRARFWLDYARYGDTHGIHVDAYRTIWPYRDYVIKSFNEDKSYDRFTQEQLAGDLLPDKSLDTVVATGFIRAGLASSEGGTITQELWVNNKRERTEAFGTVFMGMTANCAVCHDHKYDPFSAKDFYSLTAYFGNIDEKPYHNDMDSWAPVVTIPNKDDRAGYDRLVAELSAAEKKKKETLTTADAQIAEWLRSNNKPVKVDNQALAHHFPMAEGKGETIKDAVTNKSYKYESAPPLWDEYPLLASSFRIDNNTRYPMADVGKLTADKPFSISTWIRWNEAPLGQGSMTGALLSRMDTGSDLKGYDLFLADGTVMVHLISEWSKKNAVVVKAAQKIPRTKWVHIAASYDGSKKAAGIQLYLNGEKVATQVVVDKLRGEIEINKPFHLARRGGPDDKSSPLRGTAFQDLRIYKRLLGPEEMARLPWMDPIARVAERKPDFLKKDTDAWTPFEVDAARKLYFASNNKLDALNTRITEIKKQIAELESKVKVHHYQGANNINEGKKVSDDLAAMYQGKLGAQTLVCREKDTPAFAHLLDRGDYNSRGERLYANTPDFLPSLPADAPKNRLGLAQWVTMPENPLTARVTVNRMWQEIFGTGIVESSEDFGIVGARPTHQELLDHLAIDFQTGGGDSNKAWKLKRMYRMLVMSMAYRQSNRISDEMVEKDPRNLFYARAPRYRMDAETLRDAALQAAGLLNREKLGGPSFLGYQPAGIWKDSYPSSTHFYKQHRAPLIYRRTLYQFVKRTALHPELGIFDATDRLIACVRRDRTNTPLAALALLNDVTYLEAARALGNKALSHHKDTRERLNYIAKRTWSRELDTEEVTSLTSRLDEIRKLITAEEAAHLVKYGEAPQPNGIDPIESAVWMSLTSTFLNSDAFVNQ
ncbi:DUF1553 domain-containing protein [Oceaniferula spumae]